MTGGIKQAAFSRFHFGTLIALCFLSVLQLPAAPLKTKNVFFITTDGFRWQEMFTGADEELMIKEYAADPAALRRDFWRETADERRKVLLPFFWSEIAPKGQIFGNQVKGSMARIANDKKFSYPGYNEFLTGVADPRVDSNNKVPNPNTNVFEWLSRRPGFKGKVGAVVNWDVIPWILNTERSRLPVWTGFPLQSNAPVLINPSTDLQDLLCNTTPIWRNIILDSFTFRVASDYVKKEKPRAFYLAFGETDEWAHDSRYDCYLYAAHNVDRFIQTLWQTVQSMPAYRDKTTFIITTDHGRGSGFTEWRNHNEKVEGAENIWIAVIGPDTPPLGERAECETVQLNQVAATIAALLGEDFHAAFPESGNPIAEVLPAR